MKRFWLDASSVIWCDRELLPFATMPGYWNWLETKLTDGTLVTHKKIFAEIVKGADGEKPSPLAVWIKNRKGLWCSYGCTDESKKMMGEVSSFCLQKYGFETSKAFLNGADALLICRAAVDNGIVVTQESVVKAPRIPSICDHLGVEHMPMNKMNIKLGMQFRLG